MNPYTSFRESTIVFFDKVRFSETLRNLLSMLVVIVFPITTIGQTVNCPSNITVNTATNQCAANVSFSTPSVSGTCSQSQTVNFLYTGGVQNWTVPAGVSSVQIEAWGGQGRSNGDGVAGGSGGYARGNRAVSPGQVLRIYVGQGGGQSVFGGWNGGGRAGHTPSSVSVGGGGGGASDVRINGTSLGNRIIVAGGGGGAGGNRNQGLGRGSGGGGGGGYYGGGGGAAWPYTSTVLPTGGTQISGGIGGQSNWNSLTIAPDSNDGLPGTLGTGGKGGTEVASDQAGNGTALAGGTGGGNNGGNGAYSVSFTGQSGAGGSGYIGGVTGGTMSNGVRTGNGQVRLSYTVVTNPTLTQIAGIGSGGSFPLGTTTNTFRASCPSGANSTCSFTVTVVDNQDPSISCPANITVNAASGQCGSNVTYSTPTASDNCTSSPTVARISGSASGSFFPVGTSSVTWRATDAAGNTATCSFNITVNDNQNPTITCPSNITTTTASNTCARNVSYSIPTASDNCPGISVSRTAGPASGTSFNVGTTTITHVATDATGNTASCSFTVTVNDNQNPTISCPSNQTVSAASGTCAQNVTYTVPTANDNCPGVSVARTAGPASGGSFGVGTTTVTYVATDASGNNTATCSFEITVEDNENPTISGCPANISVGTDQGQCSAVVSWTAPTTNDNCGSVISQDLGQQSSGTNFVLGSTTISYTASDASGNTASCSFTVTVSDDEDPAISCPANITVDNAPDLCTQTVTFAAATFSDNCPGATLQQTAGSPSGSVFSEGTQTITYVATDAAGNTNSCSFTVTVEDNEVPVFLVCPIDISVGTDAGVCEADVTYSAVVASDNCDGTITPVLTGGLASGSTFPEGATTVTWSATDSEGNEGTCTFTVTVTDDEGPQINCPADQTVTFDGNCQYEILDYVPQVGFLDDNCDASPTVTQSPAPATIITGSTGITITAEDDQGNTASCTFFVNPNDVVDPTITCPSAQNVAVNSICQFTLPNFTNAAASDDCDPNPTVTQVPAIGSILTTTTPVTLTVTDVAGNTASCTFDAVPLDATAPVITCPANQTENFGANCEFDLADYTGLPTVNDNCDASPTVTQSPAISTTVSGTQVVTLTATDITGNSSSCTFSVLPDDTTDPVVICPSDQNVSFNSLCSFNVVNYTGLASATDNCDNSLTLTQSPVVGTAIGTTTTVEIFATDDDGNVGSCTFDVIPADNAAPSVSCPADQVVNGNASCQTTLLSYISSAIVNDNCDASPTVTQSPAASTTVSGTTLVTITAEDASGNSNNCSFNVIVNDITDPTITCGGDLNVNLGPNCTFTVGNYVNTPTVSDNCSTPTVSQVPAVSTVISGNTTVTLTATDAAGNTAACTFSILPTDNQNPTVSCPNNLNVNFNADCEFVLADYTSSATIDDNCDVNPTVVQSPAFGTVITSTQVVTITATDDAGNNNNCTFSVFPADNTNPTITCPGNQNENFSASCNFTLPDYTSLATAADNCDNSVTVSQSPAATTVITGGQIITLTAEDNNSNTTVCTFSVIPADNTDPTITCGSDLTVSFDAGCQFALLDYTGTATATDNCTANPAVTQSPNVGTVISGSTIVTLTATDGNGNTATCAFDVNPDDNEDPTVSCPGNQSVNFNVDCEYALADYTGFASANDNCDVNPTITQSPGFGAILTSNQTVTITATDDAGNTATCTFDVIPADITAPVLTCPPSQSEDFSAGCDFVLPDYLSLVTSNDNCDNSVTLGQSPIATTTVSGATVITVTGTDDAGNSSTCTFSVLPDDNTDPTIVCPSDQPVSFNAQCQFSLQNYTSLATASDNCDQNPVVTQNPVSGTSISTTTTITLTATDGNGNTGTCTFDVIPEDNTDPTISCPANQNVSADASCEYDLLSYVGLATTNDNCNPNPTVTQSPALPTTITGTTTITLTATDADGNSADCTFDVIPEDNTIPSITCPADLSVSFDAGCQFTLSSYTGSATATDNCDANPAVTQSPVSGTVITGLTEITLTATDLSGNINTCTFDVIPDDVVDPTVTCPTNQIISSNVDCDVLVPDYTSSVTALDNCDQSLAFSQSPGSGTLIAVDTTVTVTVTDDYGNTANCSFLVTPADDNNPSITCPGDQEEDFDANCEFIIIDYTGLATATDNCSATPTVTQSPSSGTIFGQTTITLTATDADTNIAVCTFDVIPGDNTAPSITCPSDQDEDLGAQCQLVLSDYTSQASTSDNCDLSPTVVQSPVAGTSLGGATLVTITSTDDNGNIGSCTFTVTPADNTAPVLACPSNTTESFDGGCEFALPDYTNQIIVSDNCDAPPFTIDQSPAAGTTIGGQTTITFSVTDGNNNTGTCTFDVIPDDDEDPTIVCPADATVSFDVNCEFALADYTTAATTNDNCDNDVTVTQSPSIGSTQTLVTSVTLTATDDAGNTANCSFNVIPEDDTDPTLACPGNQNVTFTGNCEFALLDYTGSATFSDNCDNTLFATQSPNTGTLVSGTTTVTISVTDDAGNTSTCDFDVIPADSEDPTVDCPADVTVSLSANCDFVLPDYTTSVVADDNCDASVDLVQVPASTTVITSVTATTITVTGTDDAGNDASCSFVVTTVDDADPTLVCPSDQNVDFDAGCDFTLPDYIVQSTISDNCDANPSSVQSPAIGSTISETTLISITVTDASGNQSVCSFNVIPSDNTDPTVTCPQDQNVNFASSCEFTLPDYTGLSTFDDNCDNTPFASQSPGVGTIVSGTTTVTITVLDDAGNSVNCTFDVIPNDIENPVLVCPSDVTEVLSASCDFSLGDYTSLVTATDNCDTDVELSQNPSVQSLVSSNTTVTITGTDDNGNSATCSFDVILEDQTAPAVTCPSDQNVNFGPSCQFTLLSYVGQSSALDNCDGANVAITQSPLAGSSIGGTTTVTISGEDASGNVGTCTFDIIPSDGQAPIISNCPIDFTVANDAGSCDAVVTYAAITAVDNCDGVVVPALVSGGASGTVFAVGTTTVEYTATDIAGNQATCEFDVTVEDAEDPIIICPSSVNVTVDAGTCGADVTYASVTASDNCPAPISASLDAGLASGSTFPVGTTTVTYSATDAAGNSASCSFDVTVADDEDPVITCPANITTDSDVNSCNAFVSYNLPTVTDNCATGIVPSLTAGQNSGSSFALGTTTVSYIANDGNGNSATCSFTITVEDNEAPFIPACPLDITLNTEPNTCGATVVYAAVTATDNCAGTITPTLIQGLASGSIFEPNTTTVVYTADDGNGNTATCSFLVTIIDNENPVITCPADITIAAEPNTCGADVTYVLPTVTDNCTSPITPALEVGGASGDNFPVGTTTVTYSAVDVAGNTADCSFEVTVTDDENPVVTCPADITVDNDPGICGAVVAYALPTVVDNCTPGIVPTQTLGLSSGEVFPVGTTVIRYQAVDGSGNLGLCSFSVTVNDVEDPVLTCPANVSVSSEPSVCQAAETYDPVTVADNCTSGIVPVLQVGLSSGDPFSEGTTTVTYEATDAAGNSSTCSFTVTVEDNEAPTISCPADLTESFDAACQLVIPDYTGSGTSTDNCDASPVIMQSPAPSSLVTGVTTVTLTATDFSGNENICTFTVTDDTPPTATCPADQQVGYNINCQFALPDYTQLAVSADNCGATSLTQSPVAGDLISSQTTITITVEDDFGNTSTCDFEVIPSDNISPSITCLGNQTVLFDAGCQYELPDYTTQAIASDNCDTDVSITQLPAPGDVIFGSTQIELTATDDDGNEISCVFTVNPFDNQDPTITCPTSQVAQLDANCEYQLADYTGLPLVSDNCDQDVTVTQVPAIGSAQTLDAIVTLTATDDAGNSLNCVFVVVTEDNIRPVVTCPADLDVDFDENCEYTLVDYTSLLVATDNCSNAFILSQSPSTGTVVSSSTQVVLAATDEEGNSADCTFNVNPVDNTPPELVCGNDLVVFFDENCQFEISDYNGFATTSDNCSGTVVVTQSPSAGTFITGQTTVTLTGTDGSGNTAQCTFEVTPLDVEPPTITCPADQQVSLNANCEFILPDYAAAAPVSDNCSSTITVTQGSAATPAGISGADLGQAIDEDITIILTANDGNGNTTFCQFEITTVDDTPPSISCPVGQTVSLNNDCEFAIADYASLITFSDNCGIASGFQSPAAGTLVSEATEVTASITDGNGNTSTCTFLVTPEDLSAPVITCPANIVVDVDESCQYTLIDYTGQATVVDNCGSSTANLVQFPPVGTVIIANTVVTLTATDGVGNESDCSFAIQPEDNESPVIAVCAPDQEIELNANCSSQMLDYTGLLVADDNCDVELQVTQVPAAGSSIFGAGTQAVVLTVTDDAGNTDQCQFTLEKNDVTAPTIACPSNQVLSLTASCQFILPDYSSLADADDACGDVTVTQSPVAGTAITGQLNTTLIAEDESGNTSTCTFFVDVIDYEIEVTGTEVSCLNGNDGTATVVVSGGEAPYTQDWGGFDPNALAPGLYTVTVTDANGCSVVGQVTIGNGPAFEIEIDPSGEVVICEGTSLLVDAGPGYADYDWSIGASVQAITVTNAGDYWVTVTNAQGCVSNTDTVSVSFYDSQIPDVIAESSGILSSSNDTASSYQWFLNGDPIPNATQSSYCPLQSGNYYVVIVDDFGCEVTSSLEEYTFSDDSPCATSIDEYGLSMNIYPNPSTGIFRFDYSLEKQTELQMVVYDMFGNQVTEKLLLTAQSGTRMLDLSAVAQGVYTIRIIMDNDKLVQERITVVR